MRCNKVRQLLHGYLDGELKPDVKRKLEEHLKTCESCRLELETLKKLNQSAQAWAVEIPEKEYWEGLAHTTIVRIKEQQIREVPVRARFSWQRLLPVTAAAAAAILVGLVGFEMIQNKLRTKSESRSVALLQESYQPKELAKPQSSVAPQVVKPPPVGMSRNVGSGGASPGVSGGLGGDARAQTAAKAEQPATATSVGTGGVSDRRAGAVAAAPIAGYGERKKERAAEQSSDEAEAAIVDSSVVALDLVDVKPVLKKSEPIVVPEGVIRVSKSGTTVFVNVLIETDGSVSKAELLTSAGNDTLDQAALKTVKQYRFTPALKNGKPVRVWVPLPVKF
jgi:protein TonB